MASTIYHLEMTDRASFRPRKIPDGLDWASMDPPEAEFNQRLYREVGGMWHWTDRLPWSLDKWREYVGRETLTTCRVLWRGLEAGYFELEKQDGGSVEIVYFGLLPKMIGKGLGGAMLTLAVSRAWEIPGTNRVWVHTCTEDHEHALANYRSRGFEVFKVVTV